MSVELDAYLFFRATPSRPSPPTSRSSAGRSASPAAAMSIRPRPPEQKNQVINALLTGGDITLRASDREDATADPQTRIELSLIGTDEERLRALFDGLAEGGTVRTQLERQFWGDIFGAVTDKYGIGWQVNIGAAGT